MTEKTLTPADCELGDVLTFSDSPTQFVVVELVEQDGIKAARFVQADTAEGRRVLDRVRRRRERNQHITESFKR